MHDPNNAQEIYIYTRMCTQVWRGEILLFFSPFIKLRVIRVIHATPQPTAFAFFQTCCYILKYVIGWYKQVSKMTAARVVRGLVNHYRIMFCLYSLVLLQTTSPRPIGITS